ncbi:helix-turn-helix domain-containing protein [Brevibacillus centrosporus]|uniref:helix-turn-helix domain-containing protein n=1 Tax=Brevibacillus centrosporus TaxID=54910 RepID=UPI000F09CD22|nr:helix-turn-helix domain-containing protein [Brevibacillus centrosporus]MEC2131923.1 helix-turn-helix domain-containing protein [Brevibacillus centrosporus]RNB64037.1 XRE family transcriptional regulator [Brevibacillus centrosporus]GED34172.1 transcriptional regulator [Brevibacillus centrosporus]
MPFSYKPLWHLLVENDKKKTDLLTSPGISTTTLAKLGKDEYVSMEVIDKLCSYFAVQPSKIMEWKEVNKDASL